MALSVDELVEYAQGRTDLEDTQKNPEWGAAPLEDRQAAWSIIQQSNVDAGLDPTTGQAIEPAAAADFQAAASAQGVSIADADIEALTLLAQSVWTQAEQDALGLSDVFASLSAAGGDVDIADAQLSATTRPTSGSFNVLQGALQTVSGVGSQEAGTSDLFAAAGLSETVPSLLTSLNQTSSEMQAVYDKYKFTVGQVAQAQVDTFNAALNAYEIELNSYNQQLDRITTTMNSMVSHERNIELTLLDDKLAKERMLLEAGLEAGAAGTEPGSLIFNLLGGSSITGSFTGASLPAVSTTTTSALGSGIVTAYGSDIWKAGLDFVIEGGHGAQIVAPTGGTVIAIDDGHGAGEANSFGNQIKVRFDDGQEVWFSHLDAINLVEGDSFTTGSVLGTQGNTGTTLSTRGTPGPGNDFGTHVDITMPNPAGGFYSAEEVANYMGFGQESSPETVSTLNNLLSAFQNSELKLEPELQDFITSGVATGTFTVEEAIEDFMTDNSPESVKINYAQDIEQLAAAINLDDTNVSDAIDVLNQAGYGQDHYASLKALGSISEDKLYEYYFEDAFADFAAAQGITSGFDEFDLAVKNFFGNFWANIRGNEFQEFTAVMTPTKLRDFSDIIAAEFPDRSQFQIDKDIEEMFGIKI
jgi:murein DD-endopeptidase MepM/ murein hydrolase activator NlpD|tara:strand:- start:11001 stop:12926 length:1926 start_codon:yes stop_codon:yes gene_type:complete